MLRSTFRSLRHPVYRRYFFGQTVSIVGYWLQQLALSWLVYRLTRSPVMLGAVAFAGAIPMLVVSPFAGVVVDRVDRRTAVMVTQGTQMLQAFALAALTFTGTIRAEFVPFLAMIYGVAWAFDIPVRQSLLPVMLGGRDDLPNAIALGSMMMNLGRFVGPVIAGGLLAWVGEGWCFLLNGVSFLAVMAALARLPAMPPAGPPPRWQSQMAEGFSWVWNFLPARLLIANLALMSATVPGYQSLMPIFAAEVYAGDARVQGLLVSCAGGGALAATAVLAARHSVRGLVRVVIGATLVAGVALVVFATVRSLPIACVALAVVGAGITLCASGTNTVLQSVADDAHRGRVVSIYTMSFLGVAPVSSLAVGVLARHVGAPFALAACGATCIVVAGASMLGYPRVRAALVPVYQRLGIIPSSAPPQ